MATGDLNRDGKLDAVVASFGGHQLNVLLGYGDGGFAPQVPVSVGPGSNPTWVTIADVNGDGRLDLISSNNGTNEIGVLLGNGNGGFGLLNPFGTGSNSNPHMSVVADFNGDGLPDVAVADYGNGVSVLLGATGGSGFTLLPETTYTAGSETLALAAADLNGDGKPDLVAANNLAGEDTVSVLIGLGDGGFAPHVDYLAGPAGGSTQASSVVVADFNGDGKLDLAVSTSSSTGSVSVLLGYGDGGFSAPSMFGPALTGGAGFLSAGDFNLDGRPDVVEANANGNELIVLFGEGNGQLTLEGTPAVANATAPAAADLNNDGLPDLLAVSPSATAGNVVSLLNLGPAPASGAWGDAANFGSGDSPFSVVVGDLNGDGVPDAVIANNGPTSGAGVLLGLGNGSFSSLVEYPAGSNPTSAALGDINGDGILDVAVSNGGADTVAILLGKGDGTLGSASAYAAGGDPHSVVIGDFNHDGHLDVAVANFSGSNVSLLLGFGDGGLAATTNYSTSQNPLGLVAADFNEDGNLDLATSIDSSSTVEVLLGSRTGTLSAAAAFSAGPSNMYGNGIAAGDFNHDGHTDLAVSLNLISGGGQLSMLLGYGDGGFAAPVAYTTDPQGPDALIADDLNEDGNLDVAVANYNGGTISVFLGRGDGTLEPYVNVPVTIGAQDLAAADVTGDGIPDLVEVSYTTQLLSILPGLSCGETAADDCSSMRFDATPLLTAPVGQHVTLKAEANCPVSGVEYEIDAIDSSGNPYVIGVYSGTDPIDWPTSGMPAGTYTLTAQARFPGSSPFATATLPYALVDSSSLYTGLILDLVYGNGTDYSGRGNNLAPYSGGGTPAQDRFGRDGGATAFVGSSAYQGTPTGLPTSGARTFSAWALTTVDGASESLFDQWGTPGCDASELLVNLSLLVPGVTTCDFNQTDAPTPVSTNTWVHYALTYDGTTEILYINGAEAATATQGGVADGTAFATAVRANEESAFLTGRLADVRVYNRVLSAAEVAQLAVVDLPPPTTYTESGCTSVGLAATPSTQAPVGQHVQLTPSANCSVSGLEFEIDAVDASGNPYFVGLYSGSTPVDWPTAGMAPGAYQLYVRGRVPGEEQFAESSIAYTLIDTSSLATGLVDDYSTGNGTDAVSSAGDLASVGSAAATATADRYGRAGGASAYSGSSAYQGSPPQLPTGYPDGGAMPRSFSIWLLTTDNGGFVSLFGQGSASDCSFDEMDVAISQFSPFETTCNDGQSGPWSGVAFTSGQWTHLAVTYDGTTELIYLNGVNVTPVGQGQFPAVGYSNQLFLGYRATSGNAYYSGSFSNFRVYDRVLSPTEVGWLSVVDLP